MAEPRRPASRGGPKGRPPPGPPRGHQSSPLFHPPGVGPAQVVGPRMTTMRKRGVVRGSGAVYAIWCWPTAKFLHWKPRRREPHTLHRYEITSTVHLCSRLLAAHCPQCEGHARARALLVLNPAGSTSSARSGFGLLGGRCLDPAHASTERCEHGQEQRAGVPQRGKVPPHPLRRPKQRFDGESALCSEDHVRLISHKLAATRLDLPGLASTLGMRRLSSPRPRSLMLQPARYEVFG